MEELKDGLVKKKRLKSNITKLKNKINSCINKADSSQLTLFESKIGTLKEELRVIFNAVFLSVIQKVDTYIEK